MSDPLLSTLCSICHVKPHKYRCPRCSTLTCSLPCIKRHKQWAQCNGIRDPSKYVKHKDLATRKGLDHDYNYLTSIERELDSAERNATSRGVILEEKVRSKRYRYEKGELPLKNALESCGVIVMRAPKGMSRSKQNATHLPKKSKTLRWSVEWVHPDGTKTLGMCPENQPIAEAYEAHIDSMRPKRFTKRRKLNNLAAEIPNLDVDPKLQSNDSTKPSKSKTADEISQLADHESDNKPSLACGPCNKMPNEEFQTTKALDRSQHQTKVNEITDQLLSEWKREIIKKQPPEDPETNNNTPQPTEPTNENENQTPSSPPPSFHLHHPSLPSPYPVLIPLQPDATLFTTLTNRIVLEFPTIYILPQQPDGKLPEGFISEEEFFEKARKELKGIEELEDGEVRDGGQDEEGGGEGVEEKVDEKRLMEVLGRDLGVGKGGL